MKTDRDMLVVVKNWLKKQWKLTAGQLPSFLSCIGKLTAAVRDMIRKDMSAAKAHIKECGDYAFQSLRIVVLCGVGFVCICGSCSSSESSGGSFENDLQEIGSSPKSVSKHLTEKIIMSFLVNKVKVFDEKMCKNLGITRLRLSKAISYVEDDKETVVFKAFMSLELPECRLYERRYARTTISSRFASADVIGALTSSKRRELDMEIERWNDNHTVEVVSPMSQGEKDTGFAGDVEFKVRRNVKGEWRLHDYSDIRNCVGFVFLDYYLREDWMLQGYALIEEPLADEEAKARNERYSQYYDRHVSEINELVSKVILATTSMSLLDDAAYLALLEEQTKAMNKLGEASFETMSGVDKSPDRPRRIKAAQDQLDAVQDRIAKYRAQKNPDVAKEVQSLISQFEKKLDAKLAKPDRFE